MRAVDRELAELLAVRYTEQEWEEESYSLFGERTDPKPCPACGRTGFYGPRAADPGVKFRSCRFCGFDQAVGEDPVQLLPVVHKCTDWPECAKAPYVWWVKPDVSRFNCPFCGREADISSKNVFRPGVLVEGPSEASDHPWQKVPQNRPYGYYQRFWENWEFTKGRVVL
ncbi:hypothetical protein ACFL3B_03275 [Gemmatimonadota bacterium]